MSSKRNQNIFSNLDDFEDSTDDISTQNMQRKAIKKLREIENLKYKLNLTTEEANKISNEKYWQNILNPTTNDSSHKISNKDIKRIKKQKRDELLHQERIKRQQENENQQQQCENQQQERLKRQQENEIEQLRQRENRQKENEKREQDRKKRQQERQQRQQDREKHQREKLLREQSFLYSQKVLGNFYNLPIAHTILNEFISSNKKIKKNTFHMLSLKYHPDKNPLTDTTLHQQILSHIYEQLQ